MNTIANWGNPAVVLMFIRIFIPNFTLMHVIVTVIILGDF